MWQPIVNKLKVLNPQIEVAAWDLPGFGDEPLISTGWGITEYAEWVENKLEGGDQEILLIGHSFGGRIAALLASDQPNWLKGLVLIGAPVLRRPSLSLKLRIAFYKSIKRIIPLNWRRKFYATELKDAEQQDLGKIFRNIVEFDQTDTLNKIKVPTLLLWGANDEAAPIRIALEAHALIPASRLEILPDVGHNLHLETADLLTGKLNRFANSL